jgi:hypothetical protein
MILPKLVIDKSNTIHRDETILTTIAMEVVVNLVTAANGTKPTLYYSV